MAAQRTSRSLERSAAITRLSAIHGHWAAQAIRRYRGPAPLSRSNCVALVNMRPERSGYNLNRLAAGKSFPAAIRESQERGVYDTTGWGEVTSRLGRGSGNVLAATSILAVTGRHALQARERRKELAALAGQVRAEANRLLKLLPLFSTEASAQTRHLRQLGGYDANQPKSFKALMGMLRGCLAFLTKCARDVPRITRKTGQVPSAATIDRIHAQLAAIDRGAQILLHMSRGAMPPRGLHLPSGQRVDDPLGVGSRYAPWLNWIAEFPARAMVATNSIAEFHQWRC